MSPFALVLAVLLAACGAGAEDAEEINTEGEVPETVPLEEISPSPEFEPEVEFTTTLLPPLDDSDLDYGELDVDPAVTSTFDAPLASAVLAGEHWIKWQLDAAIPDPVDLHTTFQLNILSAEDDVFGAGFTFPPNEEPFATGFCLEDRPNCNDGTVSVEVEVGPERDVLIFRIPEGTFNNATGLTIDAFIQTFPTADANPVTEYVTEDAPVPLGTDERDPC